MIKKIRKNVDAGRIQTAIELIQPVTPTDKNHQSDWWNTQFGRAILSCQEIYIEKVKRSLLLCKNKKDLGMFAASMPMIYWPKEPIEEDPEFYNTAFGVLIIDEWKKMWENVFNYFNSLA